MANVARLTISFMLTGATGCMPPVVKLAANEPYTVGVITRAASGVSRLTIDAGVGDVVIDSTSSDSLTVRAELRSHDAERLATVCAPRSSLLKEGGRDVRLRIEQPGRRRCGERWIVRLPPNVSVHVNGTVANLMIGARLRDLRVRFSGPGSVRGYVNAPEVDVAVDIGNIDLVSARGDIRRAAAIANIGSVEMSVRGLTFPSRSRPPGAVAQVDGRGEATFSARSGNGKVKVTIQ